MPGGGPSTRLASGAVTALTLVGMNQSYVLAFTLIVHVIHLIFSSLIGAQKTPAVRFGPQEEGGPFLNTGRVFPRIHFRMIPFCRQYLLALIDHAMGDFFVYQMGSESHSFDSGQNPLVGHGERLQRSRKGGYGELDMALPPGNITGAYHLEIDPGPHLLEKGNQDLLHVEKTGGEILE